MNTKIRELSLDIVNQISAGEVVERPASVIKELIENAIDAEANEIFVELVDAGKKQIIIKDNGYGINSEDIELSLKRHATSKISKPEDLFNISTLGFRGEALPAIASVSKLTIVSRNRLEHSGVKLYAEYGTITSKTKKAVAVGTTITVDELYSNTPARLKFLKKNSTELSHCINTVQNYAMAYPKISFKLIHNGRNIFFLHPSNSIEERLSAVLGLKLKWKKAESSYEYLSGEVFVCDPEKMEAKNEIKILVNGRMIRDRMLSHAVSSFYDRNISSGDHPLTILFLNIEPEFVDVNVSPTKNEVRFREANNVYGFLQSLLEQALKIKKTDFKQPLHTSNYSSHEFSSSHVEQSLFETQEYKPFNVIGQFNKQYIILEEDKKLILIDQHAAHERVNYEQILNELNKNIEPTDLLIPELLELNTSLSTLLEKQLTEFKSVGIIIEDFAEPGYAGTVYKVCALPKILMDVNIKNLIGEMIKENAEFGQAKGFKEKLAVKAASLSCHASIRGTQQLHYQEIIKLLNDLENCKFPYTCPHGRPLRVELSLDHIEKLFKRK